MIFTSKGDLTGTGQVTQTILSTRIYGQGNLSAVRFMVTKRELAKQYDTALLSYGSVLLGAVSQQAEGLGRFFLTAMD